jgi:VanZ family protein
VLVERLADPMTQHPFKFLGIVCLALWLGVLGFGLWPFDFFPRNRVNWLQNQNGIHFDRYGQAFSTAPWDPSSNSAASNDGSLSIEMWLHSWEKEYPQVSAIFSIEDPANLDNFAILQSGPDLLVRGQFLDTHNRVSARKLWIHNACQKGDPRFITLTSGREGTALYLEGVLERRYPLTLKRDSFFGRFLLGHPASGHQAWTGDLLGLAIYDQTLAAVDVSKHYKVWQDARTTDLIGKQGLAAFYPFDERSGMLIHNRAGLAPNLLIPKEFRVVNKMALSQKIDISRSDLDDIMVNILGFAPFGFFLCACLRHAKHLGKVRSILLTIALGGITSLAIELLQAYLPSRDSSLLDVIDNTLGTALGAAMHTSLANIFLRISRISGFTTAI